LFGKADALKICASHYVAYNAPHARVPSVAEGHPRNKARRAGGENRESGESQEAGEKKAGSRIAVTGPGIVIFDFPGFRKALLRPSESGDWFLDGGFGLGFGCLGGF